MPPQLDKKGLLAGLLTLIGLAVIAFVLMHPSKAKAAVVCDLEASAGVAAARDRIAVGSDHIDLSGTGGLVGAGAGCDLQTKATIIGAMVRASFMNVSGGYTGVATMKTDQLYEGAFRAGLRLHEKYTVYGLAGWSWENLDSGSTLFSNKNPNGLLLGGGLDVHVNGPFYMRGEYTWHDFQSQGLGFGAKLEPNLHVFRVGGVIKFNDPVKASDIFEDDKPVKKRKVCDPKMANC